MKWFDGKSGCQSTIERGEREKEKEIQKKSRRVENATGKRSDLYCRHVVSGNITWAVR